MNILFLNQNPDSSFLDPSAYHSTYTCILTLESMVPDGRSCRMTMFFDISIVYSPLSYLTHPQLQYSIFATRRHLLTIRTPINSIDLSKWYNKIQNQLSKQKIKNKRSLFGCRTYLILVAWKVLFQLLCPDIPNLDDFNKFQQKVIGYDHPQQTHDHQINQGPACNNYSKTSRCRCFNLKGLNKYNLWSKFEN